MLPVLKNKFCNSIAQMSTVATSSYLHLTSHYVTGVGSHALLQGTFPIQGLNSCILHCRQIVY